MIIGMSTGCFHTWDANVYEKIDRVLESRAEAIEINICDFKDFMAFDPEKVSAEISRMKVLSFHLPWKGIVYGCNKETDMLMEKMEELKRCLTISSFTIHADIIESLDIFEKFELLVENLNSEEKFGSTVKDIKEIKKIYNPNFVLDIAHVYQMDKEMKDVAKMEEIMGDNLKMLHVSGFKGVNQHSMISGADNQNIILEWAHRLHHFPIILEGQIPSPEFLEKDIELLKSHEK